jgi:histidyl-tRNA synthetase
MHERMKIARQLWQNNISAEYSHHENPKLKKQLDEVLERAIPFLLIIGTDELAKGTLKLKNTREHTEIEVPIVEAVQALLAQGCATVPAGADLAFMESLKTLPSSAATDATA